ncbi:UPF0481 protein At3g47200-like [Macadamia integrifolia]|uniref:UPF0481 protein At3g47200-like n=1 Tax=Macadamia integrifolia TaxID=60698 RepID=UPI001C52EA97|nr:UPF0481 protein At3g47200-like [Macadamia integrifolia]
MTSTMEADIQAHTVVHLDSACNNQSNSQPRIRKVPCILRGVDKNRRCYNPMVVSIGPFHHGRPGLQLLEQLKMEQEQQFISYLGSEFPAFDRNFDEVAMRARDCYDLSTLGHPDLGPLTELSSKDFKCMMFRDGCFILHFICCVAENKPGYSKMKIDQRAFVLRDLFLLENQLPFIVLKTLMIIRFGEEKSKELITNFIQRQTVFPGNPPLQEDNQPLHLLDLLRNELVRAAPSKSPLFQIWPMSQPRDGTTTTTTTTTELEGWHSFRAVTELKASGVECKRSTTCSLKEISFKIGLIKGYLLLPPIVIDDSTQPKLLNLVAYETCPDAPDDFTVTSYICFLDSLIDSAEDVKELRSKGILHNVLGSDQQVADLFNDLTIDLVPDPELYRDVKSGIERHYRSTVRSWMADMRQTYFHNPWSVIALVAATLALLLTMVQTYYAIFPSNNNDSSKKP